MAFNKGQIIKILKHQSHHQLIRCAFWDTISYFDFLIIFFLLEQHIVITSWWAEMRTLQPVYYDTGKREHDLFLLFGRHSKVSALISSSIRHFTKRTQNPQEVFGRYSHEPSDKTVISHLVSDMYYQIILKWKKKPQNLWRAICILSSSLCLVCCLLFTVAQA